MEEQRRTREFTPFEKYYFWRNKLNMYSNFRVAVEYSKELDSESIFHALSLIISQHASLSINAYTKKSSSFFQFPYSLGVMEKYKLSDVLEVINDESITVEDVFNDLQDVHFEYGKSKPLWSLILLNKKTLVYYSDHLLFDGSSGLNFHKVFSRAIEVRIKREEFTGDDSLLFDITKIDSQFQLPPKPSDLIDYSVPFFYFMYVLMIVCFPKKLTDFIKYFFIDDANISRSKTYNTIALSRKMIGYDDDDAGNGDIIVRKDVDAKNRDLCKLVHISHSKLDQLIADCRKYNVKLTSLLVVMSLLSISKITGSERDTMVVIPVNSRPKIDLKRIQQNFCHDIKTDFGLYLGDLNIELPPVERMCNGGKINWNFVKYINDYIHGSIKNSQRDLGLVSWVDAKAFLEARKKRHDNSMIGTLLVSNLGNLKDSDNRFLNAYFDQPCRSGVLSLFAMNVVRTTKGGAHLSLRSVNQNWLEIFNEGVIHQLSQF